MALSSFVSSEENLYVIYHRSVVDAHDFYGIWRWELSGSPGAYVQKEEPIRIPTEIADDQDMSAFVSIGSKIYMIGFDDSSARILELETKHFFTNDLRQIIREAPPVLASVRYRNAVAIGGKIYTFPHHFGPARELPLAMSRFQVFDPATMITKSLAEPPVGFPDYESIETYLVLRTHILLCIKHQGRLWILAFNTAQDGGWEDVTRDYVTRSARNPYPKGDWLDFSTNPSLGFDPFQSLGIDPFPFFTTRLDMLCATPLGGRHDDGSMRFFVTTESNSQPVGFAIVEFGDDPIRIKKWYRVFGLPKLRVGYSCFTHGGDVFFTFTYDDRPDASDTTWEFEKFSLTFFPGERPHFFAQLVSSFQIQQPIFDTLRASLLIPASTSI